MICSSTGRRAASDAPRLALIAILAGLSLAGCGKKGPPLAPLVRAPSRPEGFTARRLGSTVFLQVKIPSANSDGTTPADIGSVHVYGFTGVPDGNDDIFKRGTLVGSIPVRKPPEEEEAGPAGGDPKQPVKPEDRPPEPPRPPPSMENGFDQGDVVQLTEALGPSQLAEIPPKKAKAPRAASASEEAPRALGPAPPAPLPARLYVAVGISRKGRKGAVSGRQSVLLVQPPSAPAAPEVTYGETAFTISWTPPADAWPAAPSGGPGAPLKATPIGTLPMTGAFNVYDVPVGQASRLSPPEASRLSPPEASRLSPPEASRRSPPQASPLSPPQASSLSPGVGQASRLSLPAPVNPKPLSAPPFVDSRMEFGKPRCYAVRAVSSIGAQAVESDASPATCVTPEDTFAPAAPTSLKAVGSEGAISLVWDANAEADLAGYLVLRAPLPSAAFVAITSEPVKEATFIDSTVERGTRYAYVVVAVDAVGNRSLRSNQVEESAR